MSCVTGLIQIGQINQLKDMVQNLISQHENIFNDRTKFNIYDYFKHQEKECSNCEPYFDKVNKSIEKLIGQVSNQLIGLGNFTYSLLDNFSQVSQNSQQSKEVIKQLQTKNLQLIKNMTQVSIQNDELKQRIESLEEHIQQKDKQISQYSFKNQQLTKSKILFENQLLAMQNQFKQYQTNQLQIFSSEISVLRQTNQKIINQRDSLQKQIIHLNQQLKNKSSLIQKYSPSIKCLSNSKISNNTLQIVEFKQQEQNFKDDQEQLFCNLQQFPTKSSLQQDIGQQNASNICLNSPYSLRASSLNNSSNKQLSISSFNKSEKGLYMVKQTLTKKSNSKQPVVKIWNKQKSQNITNFIVQKQNKQTQVNPLDFQISAQEINMIQMNVFDYIKVNSSCQLHQNKHEQIDDKQNRNENILLKFARYLSEICIKKRVKKNSAKIYRI